MNKVNGEDISAASVMSLYHEPTEKIDIEQAIRDAVEWLSKPRKQDKIHFVMGEAEYSARRKHYGESLGFDLTKVSVHMYPKFYERGPRTPRKLKKKLKNARLYPTTD